MKTPNTLTKVPLTYTDHDGLTRTLSDCTMTVDQFDRYWIWSAQLQQNLVHKTKGREYALLSAIKGLLFTVRLRDERIASLQRVIDERIVDERISSLQRIGDVAEAFADQIKPDEEVKMSLVDSWLAEAKVLAERHPSKDCRSFAAQAEEVVKQARRKALLEAADRFDAEGQYSGYGQMLRRMAEEI
jgi:hypothetical protein